ncbi:hypothetical protein Scep_014033 [Stephania cephalantha]|uniref:Glycosyltransferase n=1 Tax=Stephania cephalantha TaxID=152367 RepID=A0AAP0J075_9MAGN
MNTVVAVMVPLPAQGHLAQLLHLSRLISARGIPVHYVGSTTHNRQAKNRLHGWDVESISNIYFDDLPLPHFITPPPNPNAPTKFPAHLEPTFQAATHLRQPLAGLVSALSTAARRVIIIYDSVMAAAAQDAALIPNAEAYCFNSISAFATLFYHLESPGLPTDQAIVIPTGLPKLSNEGCLTDTFQEFIHSQYQSLVFAPDGDLYNSCRPVEGTFLDMLAQKPLLGDKKQWTLGPFHPVQLNPVGVSRRPRHKCLEWLDKQPINSVIYVSFGTMTSISDEQIAELAIGLERSGQRFIWVLREADRGDIYAEEKDGEARTIKLPDGYEERVEGSGVIVRDWAPQLEILAHPSTGGFMSHCGWNSSLESMSMGVPIAAWPMHSDQPRNAMLITEVLKVGITERVGTERGVSILGRHCKCHHTADDFRGREGHSNASQGTGRRNSSCSVQGRDVHC